MPTSLYIHHRGELRIYDGAATPHYLIIPWVQPDPTFPLNRPRPEPVLRLNRGTFDSYTHFTPATDEILANPVEVTLSTWLDNQLVDDVLAALGNPYNLATWSVGTSVFTDASGTGASILNGAGSASIAVPQNDHDATHRRVHVEFLWYGAPAGTRDRGWRHEECYFPPQSQVIRGGDPVSLTMLYQCFGAMTTRTAFTTGTNVTPAIT